MAAHVRLDLLPDVIHRIIFCFLGPIDAFKYLKATGGAVAKHAVVPACNLLPSSQSMLQVEPNVLFGAEWKHVSEAAIACWNNMIGPITNISIEPSLTARLNRPADLAYVFTHLKPWLKRVTVHVHRREDISNKSTAIKNDDTADLCLPKRSLQLSSFTVKCGSLKRLLVNDEIRHILLWIDFLMDSSNPNTLEEVDIQLDMRYLVSNSSVIYQQFQQPDNVVVLSTLKTLKFHISSVKTKYSYGLRFTLQGPRSVAIHTAYYKAYLIPLLRNAPHLEELFLELSTPESIEALIILVYDEAAFIKRIRRVSVVLERVETVSKSKFIERILIGMLNVTLTELIKVMTTELGFSIKPNNNKCNLWDNGEYRDFKTNECVIFYLL